MDSEHTLEEISVDLEDAGDIFLALGWLVERRLSPKKRDRFAHETFSTNPVSLWLLHDYRQLEDGE